MIIKNLNKSPWLVFSSYPMECRNYRFCGRDKEIRFLRNLIDNNVFVTLYGQTGIGKTSLLCAGVIPSLKILSYNDYLVLEPIRLGNYKELNYSKVIIDEILKKVDKDNIVECNDSSCLQLTDFFINKYKPRTHKKTIVIVLDQFEEILRGDNLDKAKKLLLDIYRLIYKMKSLSLEMSCRFVISLREDDLYRLEDIIDCNSLLELKSNRFRLRPFSQEVAYEVILQIGNDCIEEEYKDSIIEKIVEYLSYLEPEGISPAVLSLVCSQLYIKSKKGKITLDVVEHLISQEDTPIAEYLFGMLKKISKDKQLSFLLDNLVTNDGRRARLKRDFIVRNIGEKNFSYLVEGNGLLLVRNGDYYELPHDLLAKEITKIRKQILLKRKVKSILVVLVIVSIGLFLSGIYNYIHLYESFNLPKNASDEQPVLEQLEVQ